MRADALGNEDPLRSLGFLLDMLDPQLNSGSAVARDEAVSSQGSGLTLTTVDAARGQGWNHCIVIGLPHQVAPFGVDSSCDTREAEARQRRLYVAATRTRGRMTFIIHGRHGEGADAAKQLVEILGEETEYRNDQSAGAGRPRRAPRGTGPREGPDIGTDSADTEGPGQESLPVRRTAR